MRVPRVPRTDIQGAGILCGRERRVPQPSYVLRWRRGLLQQRDIGVHPHQFTPRLAHLSDVPTYYRYSHFILLVIVVRMLPHASVFRLTPQT